MTTQDVNVAKCLGTSNQADKIVLDPSVTKHLRRRPARLLEVDVVFGPHGVPWLGPGAVQVLPVLGHAAEVLHV